MNTSHGIMSLKIKVKDKLYKAASIKYSSHSPLKVIEMSGFHRVSVGEMIFASISLTEGENFSFIKNLLGQSFRLNMAVIKLVGETGFVRYELVFLPNSVTSIQDALDYRNHRNSVKIKLDYDDSNFGSSNVGKFSIGLKPNAELIDKYLNDISIRL